MNHTSPRTGDAPRTHPPLRRGPAYCTAVKSAGEVLIHIHQGMPNTDGIGRGLISAPRKAASGHTGVFYAKGGSRARSLVLKNDAAPV